MKKLLIISTLATALLQTPLSAYCESECDPGDGYASCRNSCMMAAGIGLGVLIIGGMVAIVFTESDSSHCH